MLRKTCKARATRNQIPDYNSLITSVLLSGFLNFVLLQSYIEAGVRCLGQAIQTYAFFNQYLSNHKTLNVFSATTTFKTPLWAKSFGNAGCFKIFNANHILKHG
jgi:hypothetical protein